MLQSVIDVAEYSTKPEDRLYAKIAENRCVFAYSFSSFFVLELPLEGI